MRILEVTELAHTAIIREIEGDGTGFEYNRDACLISSMPRRVIDRVEDDQDKEYKILVLRHGSSSEPKDFTVQAFRAHYLG